MSKTKPKHWAAPPAPPTNAQDRPLTGRVLIGLLTGDEAPEPAATDDSDSKSRRR